MYLARSAAPPTSSVLPLDLLRLASYCYAMGSTMFRLNTSQLAEIRYRAGLTQAGLAARLGVHRNYISRIEAGNFQPAPGRLVAIAAALDVPLDDLIERVAA